MSTRRLGLSIGTAMLGVAFLTIFNGCVGYVGPDGGGVVVVGPPVPVVVFGGDYDRDHDEHEYSHRGYESRHDEDHDHGHGR